MDTENEAQSLQESGHGDLEGGVPEHRNLMGLFVLGTGDVDSSLLPSEQRFSLEQVKSWFTNEPIALAYELTTAGVLVGMSVTSLLHRFSKTKSAAVAWWQEQREKDGSVTPMCSYCLAMGTEEWSLRHDRDCPWNREQNRCARCGFVTWWDEFVAAEHCACHAEGMNPDV